MSVLIVTNLTMMILFGCAKSNRSSSEEQDSASTVVVPADSSKSVTATIRPAVATTVTIPGGRAAIEFNSESLAEQANVTISETDHPAADYPATESVGVGVSVVVVNADTGEPVQNLGHYTVDIYVSFDRYGDEVSDLVLGDFIVLHASSPESALSSIAPSEVNINSSSAQITFDTNLNQGVFGVSIKQDGFTAPDESGSQASSGNNEQLELTAQTVHTCFRRTVGSDTNFILVSGSGENWTSAQIGTIDDNYGAGNCQIAVDSAGNINLFNGNHEYQHQIFTYDSSVWTDHGFGAFETIEGQAFASITDSVVTSDGALHLVYVQHMEGSPLQSGADGLLRVVQPLANGGVTGQTISVISGDTNPYTSLSLAADTEDRLHLVMRFEDGDGNYSLGYASSSGSWASISIIPSISIANYASPSPFIITDNSDTVYVFYRYDNATTCDLRLISRPEGGSWGSDHKILEFGPTGICGLDYYEVARDPTGKFYIGYRKRVLGSDYLYVAKFDGTSWTEEQVGVSSHQNITAISTVSDGLSLTIAVMEGSTPTLKMLVKDLENETWSSSSITTNFISGMLRGSSIEGVRNRSNFAQ